MNKIAQALIVLAVFLLIIPALGQADVVYIRDGDKLYGTIQNPSFTVQAPYGKVLVEYGFLKRIESRDASVGRWVIETINNDHFSGFLLNDGIRLMLEDGSQKTIKKEQIKKIKCEIMGPSQQVTTTIFTMKNDDRFSGKFLNTRLEIRTNYLTKSIQAARINRVEFMQDYPSSTKILLENGDLIEGTLEQNQFRLMTAAGSGLIVTISNFKSIQFNAPKLVLKEFSGSFHVEKDSDGDGIPDFADICMNTPLGVAVEQDGCAKEWKTADSNTGKETSRRSKDEAAVIIDPARTFTDIQFDFDRFELKPHCRAVLDEIAVMLSQDPNVKIEIQGHADNIGTEAYNQILSEKRANVVKNYFMRKGIDKERLSPVGFGAKMGKASNETEAGRALNRRVEFAVQN